MEQFTYVIQDRAGIHARPAGILVKQAKQFESCKLTLTRGSENADLKQLLALMKLGIKHGDEVTVTVEGGDERQTADILSGFFKNNL